MKRTQVQSSNVVSIGYEDGVLEVEFRGGVYRYAKVPPIIYSAAFAAESVGKFINENVKPFFSFEKVAA